MFYDAHCDTLSAILDNKQSLRSNNLHIDLTRLKQSGCALQFFACFISPEYYTGAYQRYLNIIEKFKQEDDGSFILVESYSDIAKAKASDKLAALLTIEGGEAIEGSLERLDNLYADGVRLITLTWNHDNDIAGGIIDNTGKSLTEFGKSVVRRMNELGIIVDVSHINEESFWEVAKLSTAPFMASHSNARSICSARRNLTDEQIKAIVAARGFIGLNFYSAFLSDKETAYVSDIIRHVEHMLSLGAECNIGLGADLDGVSALPEGITDVTGMETILNELRCTFGAELTEKIAWKNLDRFLSEVI